MPKTTGNNIKNASLKRTLPGHCKAIIWVIERTRISSLLYLYYIYFPPEYALKEIERRGVYYICTIYISSLLYLYYIYFPPEYALKEIERRGDLGVLERYLNSIPPHITHHLESNEYLVSAQATVRYGNGEYRELFSILEESHVSEMKLILGCFHKDCFNCHSLGRFLIITNITIMIYYYHREIIMFQQPERVFDVHT